MTQSPEIVPRRFLLRFGLLPVGDGRPVSLPAGRPGMVMFSTSMCVTCFLSARERRDSIGRRPYPFAIDTSGTMATTYRITALGTVIVYDATGKIVARIVEPGPADLRKAFRRAGVT
jgi:hypothetical protein